MKCNPWVGGSIGRRGFPMLGTGKRGLSTYVKELFKNGEQGFFYDPNDLSTMFQDAAGTVPVTAVGQPVGLMLDKSKGLASGSELSPGGGTFDSTAGWILSNATINGGQLTLTTAGSSCRCMPDSFTQVTQGKFYQVSFEITQSTANFGIRLINTTSFGGTYFPVGGDYFTEVKKYNFIIAATQTGNIGLDRVTEHTGTVVVDNLFVKELAGNHTYQTTSASRPILRKNAVTGANYLEFDGSDDFLRTNNIDFTGTDKVSLFVGLRKLTDVSVGMVISNGTSNGSFEIYNPSMPGNKNYVFAVTGTTGVKFLTSLDYASPASNVLTTQVSINPELRTLAVNGQKIIAPIVGLGAGNFSNNSIFIGRRNGASTPFNGHIYSLIGVGKLASVRETTAIEKELAKQVGVTL